MIWILNVSDDGIVTANGVDSRFSECGLIADGCRCRRYLVAPLPCRPDVLKLHHLLSESYCMPSTLYVLLSDAGSLIPA